MIKNIIMKTGGFSMIQKRLAVFMIAVFIMSLPAVANALFTNEVKLTASDGALQERFGFSVALSGDGNTAIVGAHMADVGGNTDQGAAYIFTATIQDTTPPTITSTNPTDSSIDVAVNTVVTAAFSEPMNFESINQNTFTLSFNQPVAGTVDYDPNTMKATFIPGSPLLNSTTYTAAVTTGVKDSAGNNMDSDKVWSFTTIASSNDTDGDGVPDNEDDKPFDSTIATPMAVTGTGRIVVDISVNQGAFLTNVQTMSDSDPGLNQTGKPADHQFDDGLVSFKVNGVAPGER